MSGYAFSSTVQKIFHVHATQTVYLDLQFPPIYRAFFLSPKCTVNRGMTVADFKERVMYDNVPTLGFMIFLQTLSELVT